MPTKHLATIHDYVFKKMDGNIYKTLKNRYEVNYPIYVDATYVTELLNSDKPVCLVDSSYNAYLSTHKNYLYLS